MSDDLHCYFCGKKATVHFTQIINNKILKMDLCESCAQKHGVGDPPSFSLSDLLDKTSLFEEEPEDELVCPHCGFSPSSDHFKKMGRLGCPHCYKVFAGMLKTILHDLNQDKQHAGKAPEHKADRQAIREKLAELEQQMQKEVAKENYENAATLRDRIAELRESLHNESDAQDNS